MAKHASFVVPLHSTSVPQFPTFGRKPLHGSSPYDLAEQNPANAIAISTIMDSYRTDLNIRFSLTSNFRSRI